MNGQRIFSFCDNSSSALPISGTGSAAETRYVGPVDASSVLSPDSTCTATSIQSTTGNKQLPMLPIGAYAVSCRLGFVVCTALVPDGCIGSSNGFPMVYAIHHHRRHSNGVRCVSTGLSPLCITVQRRPEYAKCSFSCSVYSHGDFHRAPAV